MFFIFSIPVFANYDFYGNCYATFNYGSETTVRGYNYKTGASWTTHVDDEGNMRGYDSNYNHWNYNRNSVTYINYGTGKMCTGYGYSRVCN